MRVILIFLVHLILLMLPNSKLFGQMWSQVGNGTPYEVDCFIEFNGNLIVAGAGNVGYTTKGIASWDGFQWSGIGNGNTPNNGIEALAIYNNELIIAGGFYSVDNVPNTSNIAAWDGNQWHSLGTGVQSPIGIVYALEVYNGELYAGGVFVEMGGISCNRIARWNGTTWNTVGTGLLFSTPRVYSLCVYNNELYVGGQFAQAGGIPANNLARWNGLQWDSVSYGINGYVFDMEVDSLHNSLIIGGNFQNVDTNFGYSICAWNGVQILPLGNGMQNVVSSLCFYNNYLIVNQPFSFSLLPSIYFWDSTQWIPIIGPNKVVFELINYQNELYIGGGFDTINGVPFANIARYSNQTLGLSESISNEVELKILPNPSSGRITITYKQPPAIKSAFIKIYNTSGKLYKSIKIKNSIGSIQLDEGILPKGIYIATYENKKGKKSIKFVIE